MENEMVFGNYSNHISQGGFPVVSFQLNDTIFIDYLPIDILDKMYTLDKMLTINKPNLDKGCTISINKKAYFYSYLSELSDKDSTPNYSTFNHRVDLVTKTAPQLDSCENKECICSLVRLMQEGCKCGAIKHA